MKRYTIFALAFSMISCFLAGCDNFERTEVHPTIFVNHNTITLFEGETKQLVASPVTKTFSWSTTDESIATVDATGLVTAVKQGTASIVCTSEGLSFSTEVIVNKMVTLQDVILKCEPSIELAIGATITVSVDMVPPEANDVDVTDFEWVSEDENIARVSAGGTIKSVGEGTTTIRYRKGTFSKEITIIASTSFPFFKDQPFVVGKTPSTLWFRDFDRGGKGIAFEDTGGGSGNTYRAENGDPTSSMVTIEAGGNIGYLTAGEWYIYSIDVLDAGNYTIIVNLASAAASDGKYRFDLDGEPATPSFPMARSGAWGTYIDVPVDIALPKGLHKLKFVAEDGQHNPKHMTFQFKD